MVVTLQVYGAILEADADIVCLQETNVGWERFLEGRLLNKYPNQKWLNPSGMGSNYLACGSALLTKQDCFIKWAKPVRVSSEGSFFPQMVAMVDLGATRGGDVALVNVHLRPPLAMGDYLTEPTSTYSFRGVKQMVSEVSAHAWAYLYKAGQVHVHELRHLLLPAVLAGKALPRDSVAKNSSGRATPVFVVGDFNEGHWGAGEACVPPLHTTHVHYAHHAHKFTDSVAHKTVHNAGIHIDVCACSLVSALGRRLSPHARPRIR